MNYFYDQNFPAQYQHAARHLAAGGDTVDFITQQRQRDLEGVRKSLPTRRPGARLLAATLSRPYLEASVENGLAVAEVCEGLKREGFRPDTVVGHNGWGETLYIKEVWPRTPLLSYFEFYYHASGSDLDFDPEFPPSASDGMRIRTRNVVNLLGLETADWGQTPTEWQRSGYPQRYQRQISVIHEGIDTTAVHPDPHARLWLRGGPSLSSRDQVITYSARNLEPYRGFHIFMRTLPELLRRLPNARVLIVGANGVSYGRQPTQGSSWREQLLNELSGRFGFHACTFSAPFPTCSTSRCCRFPRPTSI